MAAPAEALPAQHVQPSLSPPSIADGHARPYDSVSSPMPPPSVTTQTDDKSETKQHQPVVDSDSSSTATDISNLPPSGFARGGGAKGHEEHLLCSGTGTHIVDFGASVG